MDLKRIYGLLIYGKRKSLNYTEPTIGPLNTEHGLGNRLMDHDIRTTDKNNINNRKQRINNGIKITTSGIERNGTQ